MEKFCRMGKINLRKLIEKTSMQLVGYCQKTYPGEEFSLEKVSELLTLRVWGNWIERLRARKYGAPSLQLERIVQALIQAGVDKQQIQYHDGSVHVQLKQGLYLLYKEPDSLGIYSSVTNNHVWEYVRTEEELFAIFLLEFDAARSEISSHAEAVKEAIRFNAVEYQKNVMITRIQEVAGNT